MTGRARKPVALKSAECAFGSYAHPDNVSTYDRVHQYCRDVASSYRTLTTRPLDLFIDADSIKLGDVWKQRVDAGLRDSTVFLPFVSPAYLASVQCRREFRLFQKSMSDRYIIPLVYGDLDRIRRHFASDLIWRKVQRLHYLDISQIRLEEPGNGPWMRLLEPVARRVADVLDGP
jgi:hypothetical protein